MESFLGVIEWLWFHIWFIMTLYYKMQQTLLQNVSCKIHQVLHYKMRQLLQNTSILLQNAVQAAICRHTVKHL